MKKALSRLPACLALTILLASPSWAASKWEIDPPHCYVGFSVGHILAPVQGVFNKFSGDILFDPDDLEGSRVEVAIEVDSLDTRNEKRDAHLKSGDFFAAAQYPRMVFKSSRIMAMGQGRYLARGDLTIKDVTKQIDLPFTFLGRMPNPMNSSQEVVGFTVRYTIDRLEYGVGEGHFYRLGMADKDVDLIIDLELTRVN